MASALSQRVLAYPATRLVSAPGSPTGDSFVWIRQERRLSDKAYSRVTRGPGFGKNFLSRRCSGGFDGVGRRVFAGVGRSSGSHCSPISYASFGPIRRHPNGDHGAAPFYLNSSRYRSMVTDYRTPMESTFQLLGENPYSVEDGIKDTVEWLGSFQGTDRMSGGA